MTRRGNHLVKMLDLGLEQVEDRSQRGRRWEASGFLHPQVSGSHCQQPQHTAANQIAAEDLSHLSQLVNLSQEGWRTSSRPGQCLPCPPSAEQQHRRQPGGRVSPPAAGQRGAEGGAPRSAPPSCSAGCELQVSGGADHSLHPDGAIQPHVPPGGRCCQRGARGHRRSVRFRRLASYLSTRALLQMQAQVKHKRQTEKGKKSRRKKKKTTDKQQQKKQQINTCRRKRCSAAPCCPN